MALFAQVHLFFILHQWLSGPPEYGILELPGEGTDVRSAPEQIILRDGGTSMRRMRRRRTQRQFLFHS